MKELYIHAVKSNYQLLLFILFSNEMQAQQQHGQRVNSHIKFATAVMSFVGSVVLKLETSRIFRHVFKSNYTQTLSPEAQTGLS